MTKAQNINRFIIITITLIALMLFDLKAGYINIPIKEILKYLFWSNSVSDEYFLLLKDFRLPRIFTAILSGAALSVSGLVMQTIFRNPLAGPYVLGISSGASLGVALVVMGASIFAGISINSQSNPLVLISAGIGAALVMALVLSISVRVKDILSILIIGILIAGVVNSIVSILQYYANEINVKSYIIWTMGSLNSISNKDLLILTALTFSSISFMFMFSKHLNLLLPGESFAKTMGINIYRLRIFIFIGVSILTGAVTAYCGPLGFIGIAAPHVARWIFNSSNHFTLIPASIVIGAIFMLSGDLLAHTISSRGVFPINAITAILGAPFIIWIVVKNKRTII
jgi:iron complex transport system permease protein